MSTETTGRTIVVGYDGSAASRAAVEYAIDRALPDGRLVVVHAYHLPGDFVGASYYNELVADASQLAERLIEDLARDCERLALVAHETDVAAGSAAATIVLAAELNDADEIVIGSRGVGRVRALVGSVAHDVLHRAHCPVTVLPERLVERAESAPAATTAV